MDAVRSSQYECCGDGTFDIVEALGKGMLSNCKAHAHWAREGYRSNPRPPWPVEVRQRMRIRCVWCGACQVVKLVPQFFTDRFVSGRYSGQTAAEVHAVDPAYVEMCADSSPVPQHHEICKNFLGGVDTKKTPAYDVVSGEENRPAIVTDAVAAGWRILAVSNGEEK